MDNYLVLVRNEVAGFYNGDPNVGDSIIVDGRRLKVTGVNRKEKEVKGYWVV